MEEPDDLSMELETEKIKSVLDAIGYSHLINYFKGNNKLNLNKKLNFYHE